MRTIITYRTIKLALALLGFITAQLYMDPAPTEAATPKTSASKSATLAPSGSPYHEIMKDMAADWRKASDGRVSITIYPGGVAGGEVDILRKIRIGQLHAGALSISGLSRTLPEMSVLSTPISMAWSSRCPSRRVLPSELGPIRNPPRRSDQRRERVP